MKESDLRNLISSDINKLKSGLTLLKKEQYIPNEVGTKGFIDLYAQDEFNNHVLIELKRSNAASREALHEINKYVEGIKKHFGVKDTEIRVIVASTEWRELLVPFSLFAEDTRISLQGFEILISDDGSNFSAKPVHPLPTSNGRFIAPWHHMYWYENETALEDGIQSIKQAYQEKNINDYVIVKIYFKNELSSEEKMAKMRNSVAQMLGVEESELSSLPEIPVYEYIAYTGLQILPKEKCLQILHKDSNIIQKVLDILPDMEEDEALCYLHESVEAMKPHSQSDFYEIGTIAKFGKMLDAPNCEIFNIVRYGSFERNTLLNDETIISELRGEDGSTGQKFKKTISLSNISDAKAIKNEINHTLSENPIWKSHILRIIEEIKENFPNSTIEISIFNPCTGVFTLYYAMTRENGILYLPSYHIMIQDPDSNRIYFGALEVSGETLSLSQIIDKYYMGSLSALLLTSTWGERTLGTVILLKI